MGRLLLFVCGFCNAVKTVSINLETFLLCLCMNSLNEPITDFSRGSGHELRPHGGFKKDLMLLVCNEIKSLRSPDGGEDT